jgi:hypothetical protein
MGPIFLEWFGIVGINSAEAQYMCTPNPSEVQINSELGLPSIKEEKY